MKHGLLTLAVVLYALVWGQNWTHFAAALMLAAIRNDHARSLERARLKHETALSIPGEVPAFGGVHEDALRVMPRQAEPLG